MRPGETVSNFELFRGDLHDTLNHLYDPDHQPSALVYQVTQCSPDDGAGPVQSVIVGRIAALRPAAPLPGDTTTQRIYDVLNYRYIQRLTQEETAYQMDVSVRHLRRVQQEAVHTLARHLWERQSSAEDSTQQAEGLERWQTQLREDLASLHGRTAGREADVRAAVEAVVALENNLAKQHGISLEISTMAPGLVAGVNPSLMRQMLVTAISYFLEQLTVGEITLHAAQSGESALIEVTGGPAVLSAPGKAQLLREIVTSQGGALEIAAAGDTVSLLISLPSPAGVDVLVVDDNEDLVHFYRRCTRGTRYRITHAPTAQDLIRIIHTNPPSILILDIMLPDTDGWELLTLLHEDIATRDIPVIVCSVMREQELALSLGATLYLPKPVQHHEFIQALDQVLPLVQGRPSRN